MAEPLPLGEWPGAMVRFVDVLSRVEALPLEEMLALTEKMEGTEPGPLLMAMSAAAGMDIQEIEASMARTISAALHLQNTIKDERARRRG